MRKLPILGLWLWLWLLQPLLGRDPAGDTMVAGSPGSYPAPRCRGTQACDPKRRTHHDDVAESTERDGKRFREANRSIPIEAVSASQYRLN